MKDTTDDDDFSCCGGNDEPITTHCSDCPIHPGATTQKIAVTII